MRDYVNLSKVYGVTLDDGTSNPPYTSSSTKQWKLQHRGDLIPSDGVIATPYEASRYINDVRDFRIWSDPMSTYDRTLRKYVTSVRTKYGKHAAYPPPNYAYDLPPYLYDNAVGRLRSEMGNNNLQLGTALAELPETINTIVDIAGWVWWCIRNFWRYGLRVPYEIKFKKGRTRTSNSDATNFRSWYFNSKEKKYRESGRGWARNVEVERLSVRAPTLDGAATEAANLYLTWKYGVRPLLQEIYTLIEHTLLVMEGAILSAEGVYVEKVNTDFRTGTGLRFRDRIDMKRGCKVGLTYRIDNADLVRLNSLGLINPAELLWELVPLSFVMDWFLPVGEFLRNMTAYKGLVHHSGYKTLFAKGKVERTDFGYKDSTYKYGSDPVTVSVQERMDRNKLTSFPMTGLNFKLSGLNLNQITVLLALIQQRT